MWVAACSKRVGIHEKARILRRRFESCGPTWPLTGSKISRSRHHADSVWRPILVGGVFNAVNPSVYESREHPVKSKARYYGKDMQEPGALLRNHAQDAVGRRGRGQGLQDDAGALRRDRARQNRRIFRAALSSATRSRTPTSARIGASPISRVRPVSTPPKCSTKIQQPEYKEIACVAATQELIDRWRLRLHRPSSWTATCSSATATACPWSSSMSR